MSHRRAAKVDARNRRVARQAASPPKVTGPADLYGQKGYIETNGHTYSFDLGEILWGLGTGALTGEPARMAAAAWMQVIQGDRDPLTVVRDAARIGFDPAEVYDVLQAGDPEPEHVIELATHLVDLGLLPPPPSRS